MTGIEIAGLLVSLGINVLTGLFAKKQRDKARLLPVVIHGVENTDGNERVKQTIKALATAAGVQNRLHTEVKRVTEGPKLYLGRGNRS
jgi:hypothetical protein